MHLRAGLLLPGMLRAEEVRHFGNRDGRVGAPFFLILSGIGEEEVRGACIESSAVMARLRREGMLV